MNWQEKARSIELILSDVDGVLTDGGILYDNEGIEVKKFHIRDGLGIRLWRRAGYQFGVVTARNSHIVQLRAKELGIEIIRQGKESKWPVVEEVMKQYSLTTKQVCFIGDDLTDLAAIKRVGLGVAVADGAPEVRSAASLVTLARGGTGAVRELIEVILRSKNMWDDIVKSYADG